MGMCDQGVHNPNFIAMIYQFKDFMSWNSAHYLCCLLSFFLVQHCLSFFTVLSHKKVQIILKSGLTITSLQPVWMLFLILTTNCLYPTTWHNGFAAGSRNLHHYSCTTKVILRTFLKNTFPLIITWVWQCVNVFDSFKMQNMTWKNLYFTMCQNIIAVLCESAKQ